MKSHHNIFFSRTSHLFSVKIKFTSAQAHFERIYLASISWPSWSKLDFAKQLWLPSRNKMLQKFLNLSNLLVWLQIHPSLPHFKTNPRPMMLREVKVKPFQSWYSPNCLNHTNSYTQISMYLPFPGKHWICRLNFHNKHLPLNLKLGVENVFNSTDFWGCVQFLGLLTTNFPVASKMWQVLPKHTHWLAHHTSAINLLIFIAILSLSWLSCCSLWLKIRTKNWSTEGCQLSPSFVSSLSSQPRTPAINSRII